MASGTSPRWSRLSRPTRALRAVFAMVLLAQPLLAAAEESPPLLDKAVTAAFSIRCFECHSTAKHEGDLDLERPLTSIAAAAATDPDVWERVLESVESGDMPPREVAPLVAAEKTAIQGFVRTMLDSIALRTAGDPGPVSLRRLSPMEYTYTVRDLTAIDTLDPLRDLRAQQQGSTNQAAAQGGMSEALLGKYLEAAGEVAAHALLVPDGIRFAASSTQQDQMDELLTAIRRIYARHSADGGGAAVNLQGVKVTTGGGGRLPLDRYLAAAQGGDADGLSPKYLAILRRTLSELSDSTAAPILDPLRAKFRAGTLEPADVARWQESLWRFSSVGHIGKAGGPKAWQEPVNPIVTRQDFSVPLPVLGENAADVTLWLHVSDAGDGTAGDVAVWEKPRLLIPGRGEVLLQDLRAVADSVGPGVDKAGGKTPYGIDPAAFGRRPDGAAIDASWLCVAAPSTIEVRIPCEMLVKDAKLVTVGRLLDPASTGSVQMQALTHAAAVPVGLLPTATSSQVVKGLWSDNNQRSTFGLPVIVGDPPATRQRFEAAFDEFRQVFPYALCYSSIVPVDEVVTLSLFYREDEYLVRLMLDDAERAELDRLWEALMFVGEVPLRQIEALEQLIQFATQDADPTPFMVLRQPYRQQADEFLARRTAAEPRHVQAVVMLADRAWRRPLSSTERAGIESLYGTLRGEGLGHPEAIRMLVTRVLTAPEFLYRGERPAAGAAAGAVDDWELATRLSYFLWSSLPDDALRSRAAAGKLRDPAVLAAEARRMLADPRIRRLGGEFGSEYLHVADVATLDEKSETVFPTFKTVRADMQEEVTRFFTDLFQADRSVLSVLDADHTFVNGPLAEHYGIAGIDPKQTNWIRVEGIKDRGRGGALGFAATLARQAGASRTSPILRGTWIWEVLLGQKLPKPPQGVPQLPDEAPAGLTERQLTELHTRDEKCAACHRRIDPFGYALEGFDAIGRARQKDAAGLPVDTATSLADGIHLTGLDGLRQYLLTNRRDDVVRQFCQKLLMYALGRPLLISDRPLLDRLVRDLGSQDHRVGVAVDAIVRSPQFREVRGRDYDPNR